MKIFNKIQYIILYVASFVIIGITSVISGGLGWDSFKDPIFYVQNMLTYAAIICVIVATLLMIIDKFKENDEEFTNSASLIKNFAQKTFIPSIFSRYCEYINRIRKKKQFIYNVKQQLYKLERKATDIDLYLWNKDRQHGLNEENEYCVKRTNLEAMLDAKWIEENIDTTKVKFDHITASVILSGEFTKADNFSVNDYITKHKTAKVARDKAPMLLISFGITCFISSILVGFQFNASALITFFTKLLVLCFNTYMTIRYANNYNQTVTLKDIRFRKGIIKEYEMWVKQTAQEEAKTANTDEADKLYEEMKTKAEAEPKEPTGIKKILEQTPIGAAINIIKEVSDDERGTSSDRAEDRRDNNEEVTEQ